MTKDPAVLLYTSDFLSGIAFLSMEQRGQYITLLCQQHQLGDIPENHMINICNSLDNPVIKKFIKNEEGHYYNKRMREEAEKRKTFCLSRSNNKSGRKKKEEKEITSKSYENHKIIHMENENDNVITNRNKIVLPTKEQVKEYAISRNRLDLVDKFFDYYSEGDWKDKDGKKVKNWKQKFITWENRNTEGAEEKSYNQRLTEEMERRYAQ
jgi:uncharacterized protein YdaU (DUF1376 family)